MLSLHFLLGRLHPYDFDRGSSRYLKPKATLSAMASTRTRRYSSSIFTCFSLMHVLGQATTCRLRGLFHSLLDTPGSVGIQSALKPSRRGCISKLGRMCRAVSHSMGEQPGDWLNPRFPRFSLLISSEGKARTLTISLGTGRYYYCLKRSHIEV